MCVENVSSLSYLFATGNKCNLYQCYIRSKGNCKQIFLVVLSNIVLTYTVSMCIENIILT